MPTPHGIRCVLRMTNCPESASPSCQRVRKGSGAAVPADAARRPFRAEPPGDGFHHRRLHHPCRGYRPGPARETNLRRDILRPLFPRLLPIFFACHCPERRVRVQWCSPPLQQSTSGCCIHLGQGGDVSFVDVNGRRTASDGSNARTPSTGGPTGWRRSCGWRSSTGRSRAPWSSRAPSPRVARLPWTGPSPSPQRLCRASRAISPTV